ncbi:hypothetical protein EMIT047CA2_310012 [Pseudomonas soli]
MLPARFVYMRDDESTALAGALGCYMPEMTWTDPCRTTRMPKDSKECDSRPTSASRPGGLSSAAGAVASRHVWWALDTEQIK